MTFIKKPEDFVCENCGTFVEGDGYTNHCPECLWSKHVDIFPGDRKEICLGMMEPVGIRKEGANYNIVHKCIICRRLKPNKAHKKDNFEKITQISVNNS
jgi:hypothetical protein